MATRIFGPSKGNRRPTQVAPSKTPTVRPTAQTGGGGNKAAGSPEPTAATTPTVSVSPSGTVTAEHFVTPTGPSRAQVRQKREAHAAVVQEARRVRKVRSYVHQRDKELAPKREVHVAKAFLDKAASPKPVTVAEHKRSIPGPTKAKTVPVATHARSAPTFNAEEKAILQSTPGGRKDLKQAERATDAPKEPQVAKGPELKGTPQERRQVRKQVTKARKAVEASRPGIEGNFGPAQKQFIEQTAKETGLSPATIAAQSIAEEGAGPGSPASNYEAEGENNFLNIGPGRHYSTPAEGAKATADNYKGGLYSNVLATKGQSPSVQARAIEESPWDGGHYAGEKLQQILSEAQVTIKPGNPQALKNYTAAVKKAKSLGMKVGKPQTDITAEPEAHVIKVKATADAAVKWAESNLGEVEGSPKTMKWGAKFGLNPVTQPWCANFVSNDLARRGIQNLPGNPNYVPSYEEWAAEGKYASVVPGGIADAKPGDLLAFSGEHIGIYKGDGQMISGNSSDAVSETGAEDGGLAVTVIRPKYKGGWIKVKEMTPLPGTTSATGGLSESSAPAAVGAIASPTTEPPGEGGQRRGKTSGKTIKPLTELQKVRRNVRGLREKGVEVSGPFSEAKGEAQPEGQGSSSLHSQLAALEKKYAVGAV